MRVKLLEKNWSLLQINKTVREPFTNTPIDHLKQQKTLGTSKMETPSTKREMIPML